MSYLSRDQMLQAWLDLEVAHPAYISHEVLGTSWQGRQILLFKIGVDKTTNHVWFNGTTHGGEIIGPEAYLLYIKWLFDPTASIAYKLGDEAIATRILQNNYTLIVPFTNVDGYPSTAPIPYVREGRRTNRNPSGGVNLNRNYPKTWRKDAGVYDPTLGHWRGEPLDANGACSNPSYPSKIGRNTTATPIFYCYKSGVACSWTDKPGDWEFRGSNPGSEPETQAIINGLLKWKPRFFLDYHIWDGPYICRTGKCNAADKTYHDQVAAKINALETARALKTYSYTYAGTCGMAVDDAYVAGQTMSYLIEGLTPVYIPGDPTAHYDMLGPYTDLTNDAFPRFLPIAIVFSQECEVVSPPPQPPSVLPLVFVAAISIPILLYFLIKRR